MDLLEKYSINTDIYTMSEIRILDELLEEIVQEVQEVGSHITSAYMDNDTLIVNVWGEYRPRHYMMGFNIPEDAW